MFNTQRIYPDALNGCYASYSRNSDTLDTKLLIRLVIKLDTIVIILTHLVARGSIVVKAPRHKPEGRGFETGWGDWIILIFLIFRPHWALGFIQPLTEMSTKRRKLMSLAEQMPARA
jgi:hypothetical protein